MHPTCKTMQDTRSWNQIFAFHKQVSKDTGRQPPGALVSRDRSASDGLLVAAEVTHSRDPSGGASAVSDQTDVAHCLNSSKLSSNLVSGAKESNSASLPERSSMLATRSADKGAQKEAGDGLQSVMVLRTW